MNARPGRRGDIDNHLERWKDIATDFENGAILVGNGASRNVWEGFCYDSLFEEADQLTDEDRALFRSLGEKNTDFELVLGSLVIAILVASSLRLSTELFSERYESIRNALIEAVRRVHIEHGTIRRSRRREIAEALRHYSSVYSTNYDLLLYWSIMVNDGKGFTDFFGSGGRFDPRIVTTRSASTRIHYLHGGLHLFRLPSGQTYKRKAEWPYTLLDLPETPPKDGAVPLFITEGHSQAKVTAIHRSDYLAFVYRRLNEERRPLVVFGHALGQSDRHIVNAIKTHEDRPVAVSMVPSNDSKRVQERKRELSKLLGRDDLIFFDSTTHPLGSHDLRIPYDEEEGG